MPTFSRTDKPDGKRNAPLLVVRRRLSLLSSRSKTLTSRTQEEQPSEQPNKPVSSCTDCPSTREITLQKKWRIVHARLRVLSMGTEAIVATAVLEPTVKATPAAIKGMVYCPLCTHTVPAILAAGPRGSRVKPGQKCPRCSSSLDAGVVIRVDRAA